ncbi:hypothetical protein JKF63_06213 [Porcisia hertigi]|uniref:RING-type domain-containing protein n=1 Tax=Porcisia hertigi TaxID=2761500 RepID=A0A836IU74_9TRYP|nr:hypothetical protein JKF63_06213 [Porcisia hertigi]
MSFQPICVLCLSDCDRGGGVTSCNHYLCSRCVARLPTAAPCPLCQQPYQLVKLDNPNVQQLLQDGTMALERMSKVTGSQLRHYQQIVCRMRQALAMLHDQHQDMAQRRQRKEAECAAAVSRVQGLQAEVCRLREELAHATAASAATASTIRASSQRTVPHPQAPLQSSPHQPPVRVLGDSRATHPSGGYRHEAPRAIEMCQTPSGQIIPSSSAVHHGPFVPTGAVGVKAPHLSPRGHWPRASAASSPSSSSHLHGQHRGHHLCADGSDVRSAAAGEKLTSSTVVSAAPLGWSASSLIAKRHRADSDPSLARRRVDGHGASPAQSPAGFSASTNVVLTPRSHAAASLQPRQPHQSTHASMRGPGSGGGGGDTTGSGVNFWLSTPQGGALQHPQQSRRLDSLTQGGNPYMSRPSSKPLQRLFSSAHDGSKSF